MLNIWTRTTSTWVFILFLSGSVLMALACALADPASDFGLSIPGFDPTVTAQSYWEAPTAASTEQADSAETATESPPTPGPSPTPTPEPCHHWSEVTMEDVGGTLCVFGDVKSAWWDSSQSAYFITFGSEEGSYYIVLYGWSIIDLNPGDCVTSTGEIGHLGNSPVMTIDAYDLYKCEPWMYIGDSIQSAFSISIEFHPTPA
jgi:hypothetical protein